MNKKIILPIAIVGIALVTLTLAGCNKDAMEEDETITTGSVQEEVQEEVKEEVKEEVQTPKTETKEFSMTSFYVMSGDQPKPQYSLKEITVKKGDFVRIKVTVTKGMHDFNIDEFNIHKTTPLDQEVVIEFTADKAGTFIYYCSMPGHRANGHRGTLTVTE